MQSLIAGIVAAFVGIVLGFWLRAFSDRGEKSQLQQRAQELTEELSNVRVDLAKAQSESATRAGFESLAAERSNTIAQLTNERDGLRQELKAESEVVRTQGNQIEGLNTQLEGERKNLAEKLALLDTAKEALANQFKALAEDILDKKSKSLTDTSHEKLGTLLNPLREQIKDFREKVEEAQKENLISRGELASELKNLKTLNENLSSEAHSLSTALRQDTQKQGHWGEQILLLILEKSGYLKKGIHYTYQESFSVEDETTGEKRKKQTDVIVKLPEGRHLIIDCKVTLRAYDEYTDAADDNGRNDALKKLLKSFRDHYNGLAERNYQHMAQINSPDFVVLFAPLEPAFLLAIQKDESLWMDAYEKGVLLAGPTTVLFVLRIVENLWKQQEQSKNVQKVMDRGGKLYDKFVGFVEDLEAVGNRIREAGESYKEAVNKLTSGRENLVRQVEMLRELEVKNKKKLKPKLLEAAGVFEEDETVPLLAAEAETDEVESS